MKKLKTINLKEARKMSEDELQLEIKKRAVFLKEEYGMDKFETADFVTSLLNLGASLQETFDRNKK